jgi:3-phytase
MTTRRCLRFVIAVLVATGVVVGGPTVTAQRKTKVKELEFLGEQIIPTGTLFEGTQIGGLSSLAYDASRDLFYALSDDPSQFNRARFYTLRLDAADGQLDAGDIDVVAVTTLLDTNGQAFAPLSLDPEGHRPHRRR